MICERTVKKFCNEDISLIANYDLAITDMEHTWHCHHRLEIGKNGEVISKQDLIRHRLYYNRPSSELIFLTKAEHIRLHNNNRSKDTRRKISEEHTGRPSPHKGDKLSDESRRKISEAQRARWAKRKMTKE